VTVAHPSTEDGPRVVPEALVARGEAPLELGLEQRPVRRAVGPFGDRERLLGR
jgi:hypothetical protein